jgi:hypothetical protein
MVLQVAQVTTANSAPERGRRELGARGRDVTRGPLPWHYNNIRPPGGRRQRATKLTKAGGGGEGVASRPLSPWGLNVGEVPQT